MNRLFRSDRRLMLTTPVPASRKKRIGVHRWERSSKSQVISRRFTKTGKTVGYFNIFDRH